jgi:drug/metabolite transporter (DMT)-like permease
VAGALSIAVAAISTAALAIRLAEPLPAGWIAAGRVAVTAAIAFTLAGGSALVVAARCRQDPKLAARVGLAGLLLGAHFGTWIASLTMTSVLKSVALVTTQPLFAAWFGRMLGDRVEPRVWIGSGVALLGAWIMTGSSNALDDGLGVALALAGAAFAAAYLAVGRSVRQELELWGYFGIVNAVAAVALGLYAAVAIGTRPLSGAAPVDLAWVVYLGVVPGVLGHGMLNWAVQRVPVHVVSLVAILETVGAGLLAWAVLDEVPTESEAIGALVLGLGVGLGVGRARGD